MPRTPVNFFLPVIQALARFEQVHTPNFVEAVRRRAEALMMVSVHELVRLVTSLARAATFITPQHGWTTRRQTSQQVSPGRSLRRPDVEYDWNQV